MLSQLLHQTCGMIDKGYQLVKLPVFCVDPWTSTIDAEIPTMKHGTINYTQFCTTGTAFDPLSKPSRNFCMQVMFYAHLITW